MIINYFIPIYNIPLQKKDLFINSNGLYFCLLILYVETSSNKRHVINILAIGYDYFVMNVKNLCFRIDTLVFCCNLIEVAICFNGKFSITKFLHLSFCLDYSIQRI